MSGFSLLMILTRSLLFFRLLKRSCGLDEESGRFAGGGVP